MPEELCTASTSKPPVLHLSPLLYPVLTPPLLPADPLSVIKLIRDRNMKVGVAISPDTPSTAVTDEIANAADMLLVMTVYPGIPITSRAFLVDGS